MSNQLQKIESRRLLSILIPTKNRQEYLIQVLEHILKIKDNRIQVVIQDNSDSDILKFLLTEHLKDRRVTYSYCSKILSFVENFNQGLEKCIGEYITIIGDDDGINPHIIDVVEIASKNKIEAITPSLPIVYYWPNSGVPSVKEEGRLRISDFSSYARLFKCRNEIRTLLKNGCQSYLSLNLAKVYHGIVKRSILEQIKEKTGRFVGGLSPDIYLSTAVSLLTEQVLIVDYPLTISGICKKSGSSDSATGKHTGQLSEAPHFKGHSNYKWSDKVPKFYSVETIWADSALAAITDLKFEGIEKNFRVDILSAYCLLSYPKYQDAILANLSSNFHISKQSLLTKILIRKAIFKVSLKTLLNKIRIKLSHRKSDQIFTNIPDMKNASEIIQASIDRNDKLIFQNIQEAIQNFSK